MTEPRRKRGRERVYDAQRTREAILSAAETVFAERGFDGTSVDAISSQAGYNKSLLFQYFGDKLGLYSQVLKRSDREMGELMGHAFAEVSSGLADAREYLVDFVVAGMMESHPETKTEKGVAGNVQGKISVSSKTRKRFI